MNTRKDLAGWLDGPPLERSHAPGEQWGCPATGPGSIAPYGRRFLGLLIDWMIAVVLSVAFFNYDALATLVIFCVHLIVLHTLVGASLGQLVLGLRVRPVAGRTPMLVRAVIRTAVMLTVISGLYRSADGQPLHDMAAGTAVVRA